MKRSTWFVMVVVVMLLFVMACGTGVKKQVDTEPFEAAPGLEESKKAYKDSFFTTARFIMTKHEIGIYKHLPDKEARNQFQADFWKKRDPSPETEENENLEEFEDRIVYANKWFSEHSKGRGWDTERGRLLLQLGFPDRREWGEAEDVVRSGPRKYIGNRLTSKPIPMEIWTYYNHHMVLVFADLEEKGRLHLLRVPIELPGALERAKFGLDLRDQRNIKQAFRFNVEYKADRFEITIPVKKVSFEEKDEKMMSDFGITIYVYKNKKKIDEINTEKSFSMEKDKLLEMKTIDLSIPYTIAKEGKYHFDVVIEEKSSQSKFRDFTEYKL